MYVLNELHVTTYLLSLVFYLLTIIGILMLLYVHCIRFASRGRLIANK